MDVLDDPGHEGEELAGRGGRLVLERGDLLVAPDPAAAAGEEIDHFVAIGGGAASDLWLQILADATDRPVKRAATVEASSLGAAMAAAAGIGWYPTIAAASAAMSGALSRTFSPDPGRASRYRELRAIHADLWPALAAWNRRLFDFVERGDG